MMRTTLLRLSQSTKAREAFTHYKFMQRASRRFVAGETLAEALEVTQALNRNGIMATLDHLGENVVAEGEARAAQKEYFAILDQIKKLELRSNVSLKLTQVGMNFGVGLCYEIVRSIVERAKEYDNFVRLDMESSAYTDRTLQIYERLRNEGFANTGVVIQSYLYRSEQDIERLREMGASVRLCKGAYREPASLAFPQKKDVDANYCQLVKMMLSEKAQQKGAYVALATHDEAIIDWAKEFTRTHKIDHKRFEFQMLYGIRRDLQQQLLQEGYRVRVYVSYGAQWYPYFMRRLAERPANLLFLIKNFIRG